MTSARLIATVVIAVACATPCFALEVKKQVVVKATPEAAWSAIGDFCGIAAWHPAVAKCELSKIDKATLRTLSLNGGGTIVEKLTKWDGAKHRYSYDIVSGPLPVANYHSTISVKKTAMGTVIGWVGKFDAAGAPDAKAVEAISGVYGGGLDALAKKLTP